MTKTEFLQKIFEFFGKNDENLLKIYFDALDTRKQIDWNRLYLHIIKTTENGYLPKPKYFISLFPQFEMKNYKQGNYNGYQVRITYKSGRFTDFVVTNWADTSLKDLIIKCQGRDDIKRAELYEPTVTLMAHSIYPKDAKAELLYEGV